MNEPLTMSTIGEIVAANHRAAAVFERFGIDFCCGGHRSLEDACLAAAAEQDAVVRALDALPPSTGGADDVTQWPVPRLIDHIVSTHHEYVRWALPAITRRLATLEEVHAARHPELRSAAAHFAGMRAGLEQHLMKEEQVLFPYVRDLAKTAGTGGGSTGPFGAVENPIRMMMQEHHEAAGELRVIRELTHGYAVPSDGCATYTVCMRELEQFERDLHRHVHLENNVLFPKAVELERAVRRR